MINKYKKKILQQFSAHDMETAPRRMGRDKSLLLSPKLKFYDLTELNSQDRN